MPIVPKRYDTGFVVKNCNTQILSILEPWCDTIYVDCEYKNYVDAENENSEYEISDAVKPYDNEKNNHILISFDASKLTNQHFTEFIKKLPFIIEQTGEVGSFNWDIFQIDIISLEEINMIKPHFKNVF